jgi:hypothetical protein
VIALVLSALAGSVPDGLRPALAPSDVAERWAAQRPDAVAGPACSAVLDGAAQLCFRVWEGRVRRFVTTADLTSWAVDGPALMAAARERSAVHLERFGPAEVVGSATGPGGPQVYWVLEDGDGWAAGALLHAELAAGRVGGTDVRFAVPRTGVLLAWRSGSAELDRIMAVAAREMYDAADDAVTPDVFVWSAGRFVPFGRAVPRGG